MEKMIDRSVIKFSAATCLTNASFIAAVVYLLYLRVLETATHQEHLLLPTRRQFSGDGLFIQEAEVD